MNYLENYYANYDEEGRLASKHGQVEFLTTMKYIHEFIGGTEKKKILEVGAGTGNLFEMVRLEENDELNACFENIKRVKIVAADGATNYMRECIDTMDDATFDMWMRYHFSICERMDLVGATNHSLDILQKQ